jgi:hypothetical protein
MEGERKKNRHGSRKEERKRNNTGTVLTDRQFGN